MWEPLGGVSMGGGKGRGGGHGVHLELGDLDAAVVVGEVVAVAPLGVEELRALDDNLGQVDARAGVDFLGDDVDAGAEAEDEAGVGAVEHEVAAGQHDLAGGRHGDEGVLGAHVGLVMASMT